MGARRPSLLACLALGCLAGCRDTAVTCAFGKSLLIQADVGGTLGIGGAEDSVLAGASLTVPPYALARDTLLTIGCSGDVAALAGTTPAGPVVAFGAADGGVVVFNEPATVTLPFALPPGSTAAQLSILSVSASGVHVLYRHDTVATSGTTVSVEVASLGAFGAVVAPNCAAASDCQGRSTAVQTCLVGLCSGELRGTVELGCASTAGCLPGGSCDAGLCDTGLSGSAHAECLNDADCPQSSPAQHCVAGVCQ